MQNIMLIPNKWIRTVKLNMYYLMPGQVFGGRELETVIDLAYFDGKTP